MQIELKQGVFRFLLLSHINDLLINKELIVNAIKQSTVNQTVARTPDEIEDGHIANTEPYNGKSLKQILRDLNAFALSGGDNKRSSSIQSTNTYDIAVDMDIADIKNQTFMLKAAWGTLATDDSGNALFDELESSFNSYIKIVREISSWVIYLVNERSNTVVSMGASTISSLLSKWGPVGLDDDLDDFYCQLFDHVYELSLTGKVYSLLESHPVDIRLKTFTKNSVIPDITGRIEIKLPFTVDDTCSYYVTKVDSVKVIADCAVPVIEHIEEIDVCEGMFNVQITKINGRPVCKTEARSLVPSNVPPIDPPPPTYGWTIPKAPVDPELEYSPVAVMFVMACGSTAGQGWQSGQQGVACWANEKWRFAGVGDITVSDMAGYVNYSNTVNLHSPLHGGQYMPKEAFKRRTSGYSMLGFDKYHAVAFRPCAWNHRRQDYIKFHMAGFSAGADDTNGNYYIIFRAVTRGGAALNVPTGITISGPTNVGADMLSSAFTISSHNSGGVTGNVTINTTFFLSSNSPGTTQFFSNSEGTSPISAITIPNSQSSVSFYYTDSLSGSPTITASTTAGMPLGDAGIQTTVYPTYIEGSFFTDLNHNGVRDSGEPGIMGATVNLLQGDTVIKTTLSDVSGIYRFSGIDPGNYDIQITNSEAVSLPVTSDAAHIEGTAAAGITVTLLKETTVLQQMTTDSAGYYRFDGLGSGDYVVQYSAIGVPNSEITIAAIPITGSTGIAEAGIVINLVNGGIVALTTVTDAAGNYVFPDVTPGVYAIEFVATTSSNFATSLAAAPATTATPTTGTLTGGPSFEDWNEIIVDIDMYDPPNIIAEKTANVLNNYDFNGYGDYVEATHAAGGLTITISGKIRATTFGNEHFTMEVSEGIFHYGSGSVLEPNIDVRELVANGWCHHR